MRKTNKAALARHLEQRAAPADTIPTLVACIIDAMSLMNKVSGDNMTFGEISEHIFKSALLSGIRSERIDVVFDVYRDISKNLSCKNQMCDNMYPEDDSDGDSDDDGSDSADSDGDTDGDWL
jgi:hypothetical protein